jgi:hypothetical protein
MESNLNYNVKELKLNELSSISGGDRITRAVFTWLGNIVGHLERSMGADAQHGVKVRNYN